MPENLPLIVGIGGTVRPGSTTERAIAFALRHAATQGAETRLYGGDFLARLPHFDPRRVEPTAEQAELAEAVRRADGLIVASPGYHGSISGLVKNAFDTLELTARDAAPYFQDRPIGVIVTADGWQATGGSLAAMRAIIHALRGWPTPFGAGLNVSAGLFDEAGDCRDPKDAWALRTVADQVMGFGRRRAA